MKFIYYPIAISTVTVIASLLTGCVAPVKNVSPNFSFKPSDKIGLAAFSVKCIGDGGEGTNTLTLQTQQKNALKSFLDPSGVKFVLPLTCTQKGTVNYFAHVVPAGDYLLTSYWQADIGTAYPNAHFDVTAGKVNYAGRLIINALPSDKVLTLNRKVDFKMQDAAQADLHHFKMVYKNIPSNEYIKSIASLQK